MRVIHLQAQQGHPVPQRAMEPRGPFQHYEPVVVDLEEDPDEFPYGATAQNNMRGVDLYECQGCEAVLLESELDSHMSICGEDG